MRLLAISLLLVLTACQASRHRPPHAAAPVGGAQARAGGNGGTTTGGETVGPGPTPVPGSASSGDPVLATYEGREIRASELGQWFLKTYRREALAALSKLIGLEIVQREADRIGLQCSEEHLTGKRKEVLDRLGRDAAVVYGIGTTVERYVALRYQQSVETHVRTLLESERQRWLFSRVIRLHALQTDRLELSMIVVSDRATADEVKSRLDQGADFGRVAERYSTHESKKHGGRLPALPKEALSPAVGRRASELSEGERTGILEVDDGRGHRQFEIIQLRKRLPGRSVTWDQARGEIEAGLREAPVDAAEWTAWYLRLERLYKVQVAGNL
ncbi:MAG: hypothetical protein CMJ83_13470 [Planctomycetes bacterium]|nr:hypothetical protein [Planctomycetota bacterium]